MPLNERIVPLRYMQNNCFSVLCLSKNWKEYRNTDSWYVNEHGTENEKAHIKMKKLVVVLFAVMFTILAPAGHCEFLSQVITRDQNDDVFQQRLAKRGKPSLWQIDNASLTPAQKIAKAMGLTESGGKPVVGASGEIRSVWQYTKPTWNSLSKAYNKDIFGKNEPLPWTRANGEHVTVWKVEQLMSKGRDVREIALIWNTSLGGSEKPLVLKGVNRHNVPYDSSKHAQKVVSAWRKL